MDNLIFSNKSCCLETLTPYETWIVNCTGNFHSAATLYDDLRCKKLHEIIALRHIENSRLASVAILPEATNHISLFHFPPAGTKGG